MLAGGAGHVTTQTAHRAEHISARGRAPSKQFLAQHRVGMAAAGRVLTCSQHSSRCCSCTAAEHISTSQRRSKVLSFLRHVWQARGGACLSVRVADPRARFCVCYQPLAVIALRLTLRVPLGHNFTLTRTNAGRTGEGTTHHSMRHGHSRSSCACCW